MRKMLLIAALCPFFGCSSDDATPPDSPADTATDTATDIGLDTAADAFTDDAPDTAPADTAASADAASADAGHDQDTTAPECTVVGDCNNKGPAGECRGWACNDGSCTKVGIPDDSVCNKDDDKCKPGLCQLGACKWAPATCPDATPNDCVADTCDPASGSCTKATLSDGAACDDGDECTTNDACKAGKCGSQTNTCDCAKDLDCAGKDDANLCNGTLYCDATTHKCLLNPATVVTCPPLIDKPCQSNTCTPTSGKCEEASATDGSACTDDDNCTVGDGCVSGACKPGTDTCVCQSDAECAAQEDGDACNGTLFCNKALTKPACELNPATVVTCPSAGDTECASNLCHTKSAAGGAKTAACAMTPRKDGTACEDGNPCTPGDTCKSGACMSATNTCTCKTDADCAKQEDGNLCNGTLFCHLQDNVCAVNPTTKVVCPSVDDTACATNKCAGKTGKCALVAMPDGVTCTDGDACTQADACVQGACKSGITSAACACKLDADCAKFEDGNLCNGTLACQQTTHTCVVDPQTTVVCQTVDNTTCIRNSCVAATGTCTLQPVNLNAPCDDNNPCTNGDRCDTKGTCAAGNDVCDCGPHLPDFDCEKAKGDGNKCNGVLWCDKATLPFKCVIAPKTVVQCPTDGDGPCRKNMCAAKTGACGLVAVAEAAGKPCDDNNACTSATSCKDGLCAGGKGETCDDNNPCSTDSCDPAKGCVYAAIAGKTCDDGKVCTEQDTCADKVCTGVAKSCDDGNACTTDVCVDKDATGCTHAANTDPCSDGDACTQNDTCANNVCGTGTLKVCNDDNVCTTDHCDNKTGACVASPLSDRVCTADGEAGRCSVGQCVPVQQCGLMTEIVNPETIAEAVALQAVALRGGAYLVVGGERVPGQPSLPRATFLGLPGAVTWTWRATGQQADAFATAVLDVTDAELGDGDSVAVVVGSSRAAGATGGAFWRLSRAGKLQTALIVAGAGGEVLHDVAAAGDGVVAAGVTGASGERDCWLVHAEPALDKVSWQRTIGGAGDEVCYGVAVRDGKLAVAGQVGGGAGGADGFVAVTDDEGKVLWQKSVVGPGDQRLFALGWTRTGGLIAVGRGAASGVVKALAVSFDESGNAGFSQLSSLAAEWTGLVVHASGGASVLGQGGVTIAGGAEGSDRRAAVLARLGADGKVTWSAERPGGAPVGQVVRLGVLEDGYLHPGTGHVDPAGDGKLRLQARLYRTDSWGEASCVPSGACARPALRWCDDGEPCTDNACDAKLGCRFKAVAACQPATSTMDLDHDGKTGTADPCPTVWNPDGAQTACPPIAAKATKSLAIQLGYPVASIGYSDAAIGYSDTRRSNEVAEIPLRNGTVDASLAAWWKLDGDYTDASDNTRVLTKAAGAKTEGAFGPGSTGMAFPHAEASSSTLPANIVTSDFTLMLWARVRGDDSSATCTLFDSSSGKLPGAADAGHAKLTVSASGRVTFAYGSHDGSYEGPGLAEVETDRRVVAHDSRWHHFAAVSRAGVPVRLFMDGALLPYHAKTSTVDGKPVDDPVQPIGPVGLRYVRLGDKSDCSGALDDALVFTRALTPAEIADYVGSKRPYASTLTPGARPDFGGVVVAEQTPREAAAHRTHAEVVGPRPYGVANLDAVVAYWPLDGDATDKQDANAKVTPHAVTGERGRFGMTKGALLFDGKTSYVDVLRKATTVNDFTVEAWFWLGDAPQPRMYLLDTRGNVSASTATGVALIVDQQPGPETYRLSLLAALGGEVRQLDNHALRLPPGWHHIAMRRKNSELSAFIDGVPAPGTWSGGDTLAGGIALFGSQPARLGYHGLGKTGQATTDGHLHGGLDEVIVHSVARDDDYFAKRAIGLPRVRFFAHTTAASALDGYPYHRYWLRWGDADAKPTPNVIADLGGGAACSTLLSSCTGYAGWWRFDALGGVAVDSTNARRHGTFVAGAQQGAGSAYLAGSGAHIDLGAWSAPLAGTSYTIEWRGLVGALPTSGSVPLLWRKNDAPGLAIAAKKWSHAFQTQAAGVSVAGPSASHAQSAAAHVAGTYDAQTKTVRLHVDGAEVGKATATVSSTTQAAALYVGKSAAVDGFIGRVDGVRVMSRALAPDELLRARRTVWAAK